MQKKKLSLHKASIIRQRKEIVTVQNRGKKIHTKNFLITYSKRDSSHSRFAVTVSKRVDKRAVIRNRVKRQLRALYQAHQHHFTQSYDIVFIAKQSSKLCSFQEISRQIITALKRHQLLER